MIEIDVVVEVEKRMNLWEMGETLLEAEIELEIVREMGEKIEIRILREETKNQSWIMKSGRFLQDKYVISFLPYFFTDFPIYSILSNPIPSNLIPSQHIHIVLYGIVPYPVLSCPILSLFYHIQSLLSFILFVGCHQSYFLLFYRFLISTF